MDHNHLITIPNNLICQSDIGGSIGGIGPLGNTTDLTAGGVNPAILMFNKVISITIGIITAIAFLYFIILFFTAALSWVSAGGDQKKVESAGKQITNAIIGLVITVAAFFLIDIIGKILKIPIFTPLSFIEQIW